MKKKIERILKEIKRYLKERYGEKIRKVILYGSYARGEATEDSDVDVMVVISDDLNTRDVERYIDPFVADILLEKKELVSVIVVKESVYENEESDIIMNVHREGVVV